MRDVLCKREIWWGRRNFSAWKAFCMSLKKLLLFDSVDPWAYRRKSAIQTGPQPALASWWAVELLLEDSFKVVPQNLLCGVCIIYIFRRFWNTSGCRENIDSFENERTTSYLWRNTDYILFRSSLDLVRSRLLWSTHMPRDPVFPTLSHQPRKIICKFRQRL